MALQELDNSNIQVHLGKTSEYKSQYDAALLVREPRSNNRKHINVDDDNLPFVGYDTWNAYEVSCLLDNGMPISCIAKIVYPCSSKYIVESKSLKLYLNSFNMTKCGETEEAAIEKMCMLIADDLTNLLGADTSVNIEPAYMGMKDESACNAYYEYGHNDEMLETLEDVYGHKVGDITVYKETPELLEVVDVADHSDRKYHSSLLKSNCRVTSQPDWGDVYISYRGAQKTLCPKSLLRYIVSFRDECHFHEEICETIFVRLKNLLDPARLTVMCLYARRGGIDINPIRSTHKDALHSVLVNAKYSHIKTTKQ